MDIYVFDKSFNMLGIIDRYTSLIWTRQFHKRGTFELHAFVSQSLSLLQKGNILVKSDNSQEAVMIETITLRDEDAETIVVRGFFIENFLNDRFVWGTQTQTGTIEDVMKGFVKDNCITPTDVNRIIPNLILSPTAGITIPATEVNSYDNLALLMEELAIKYDVGWRIIFDIANKQYAFEVYAGNDLSINQTLNPQVIFSSDYENVLNQEYTDSDANHRNMTLVGGEGDGPDRIMKSINDAYSGFDRKELFLDAGDIPVQDEYGYIRGVAEYSVLLEERGKSVLAELQPIKTFESGISVLSNLIYRQDYDLGDIVTYQNDKWGLTVSPRITMIEEVYENNSVDIRVNFGSNIPTIMDKLKRVVR